MRCGDFPRIKQMQARQSQERKCEVSVKRVQTGTEKLQKQHRLPAPALVIVCVRH